jgi:hypothetical protein
MDALLSRVESSLVSQMSLVTLEQLNDAEITEGQRRGLLVRNVLRKVRPGVYALSGVPESWERGLMAVVLSVPDAVASHSATARLWNVVHRPDERYEVTTGRDSYPQRDGVTIHRCGTVTDDDKTEIVGIPCTTFERTLCDCTDRMSRFQVGRALDDGLRRGIASLARLEDCAERLESARGRRMSIVRALLAERGHGFDPGGSASELHVMSVLRRARLPLPVQQHRVVVDGRTYRLDYAWPGPMVFIEWYGLPFHTGASAVVYDSQRLTALSAAGWLPLVFTDGISDREIVERTAQALQQRGVGSKTGA